MAGKIPENEAFGESPVFLKFQEQVSKVAKVDRPVLLIGERGSGKELAASRLHYLSDRWESPFLTLNCAALPEELIESELFGYVAGAFTGASKMRKGRFEEAHGGTLFLDEMGLIPLNVQEKILRVVEYGSFERLGSSESIEVDVRIIGATNADLLDLCKQGKFKRDLLDRLSFEVLFLPPLRERTSDILLLANHFAARMASELSIIKPEFSEYVQQQLLKWAWPGNIRELKNTVERAVYKCTNGIIQEVELNPFKNPYAKKNCKNEFISELTELDSCKDECVSKKEEADVIEASEKSIQKSVVATTNTLSLFDEARRQLEINYLKLALTHSGDNQKKAATVLNISYDSFRGLYRKYKAELTTNN